MGNSISSDGCNNTEIASRLAQAKKLSENEMKKKNNISSRTETRALECYIVPILMYGCKAWTISNPAQKKPTATKMWFQRMLLILWTAQKPNETVLRKADTR